TLYMKLHIEPYFKPMGLALDAITPQHLQDYYTFKRKAVNGKAGLASNSLRKHHVVLHSALQEAMRKNLIAYNPADRVSVPKKEEFIGKAYNAEQANELIALLSAEPLKSAVILGLFYGLRRSEVCGMRWRDIDFKAGTMRVCNTVVKTSTVIEHEMTKSKASKRTMILIPETVPYLQHLQRKQLESRLLMGRCYQEGDHVCVWENGKPVGPDYVSHAFNDFLAQNNLPHIRFHELRHTTGSLLLEKGLSAKQIQEYLGHEKVSTTLDIYGHLSIEGKKEAAHVMDGVLDLLAI
ncbi:MAG: tyrosine-type recombinase/integrase, partial [Oscillospiraceae bacterium]